MVRKSLYGLSGAYFSPSGSYRYLLWRRWHMDALTTRWINFIMLNPSTATEVDTDPTINRCITRAMRLGYGGLYVTNLFAWRSTDPSILATLADPVGPYNDAIILETARIAKAVVCAWGNHGGLNGRSQKVKGLLKDLDLTALRISKTGEPAHPLYLPYSLIPVPFGGVLHGA